MNKCAVYGCVNNMATSDSTIQYYFFPTHPTIAQQWIDACCIWPPTNIDLNTARICSVHFDNDSYTSQYKMVDYPGVYAKVLKFHAVPTLYLPQQESTVKPQLESPSHPNQMKQMLIYNVTNQEENFETSYDPPGLVLETLQDSSSAIKYEELRNMHPTTSHEETIDTKIQIQPAAGNSEENGDKYSNIITYKQLKHLEMENEKMKKELSRLQQTKHNLHLKLQEKINLYKKFDAEYSKLNKQHTTLERKCMSVGDQKSLLSKVFSESQIKILSGKKKIYWSNDDMAIGYTIRHMSSKRCYMYLSKKLNIPLPALSSIKRWQTLKKGEFVKEENLEKEDRNGDSDE